MICAGYFALYVAWQLVAWDGSTLQASIGAATLVPPGIAAILTAYRASRRVADDRRTSVAWRWLALSFASLTVGFAIGVVYSIKDGAVPFPSSMDIFVIAFYPLFAVGLLRFPTQPSSRRGRQMLALDITTVMLGSATVVWYLVLGPTLTTGRGFLATIVAGAYPVGDLAVIFGVTFTFMRTATTATLQPLRLLGAAFCLATVGDLLNGWLLLHSSTSGTMLPWILFMAATLLYVVAGSSQGPLSAKQQCEETEINRTSWLPYLAAATVCGLLIAVQRNDAFFPDLSVTLAAAAVLSFVLLRQFVAQRDLLAAHVQLAARATSDPLTGLANHGAIVGVIDRELERAERYQRTCAVLFFDVDHFKSLNDRAGHAAGDLSLRQLAAVMQGVLRTIDTVGRWGGEEFVVVLPEVDIAGALDVAERLRAAVADHAFGDHAGLRCTVSVGVAAYPRHGSTRSELVDAADRAMYAAKRLGRNQTRSFDDPALGVLAAEQSHLSENEAALEAVEALALLVAARDDGTGLHTTNVAMLAEQVAVALGCDEDQARQVYLAAKLHDVGKVAIADAVLRKPGALSPEEWETMKQHPAIGADIVARMGQLADIAPIIRAHHERYDGHGYPDGLSGEEIPLAARIVGVADAFDAMVSDRPYRRGMNIEKARYELLRGAGSQFDPAVVAALDRILVMQEAQQAA